MNTPCVKPDEKGILTLYVDGKPFFCYSGEIHNSSASDQHFMEEEVWPKLRGLGLNAVIVPVYWEKIEETEGTYDFTSVDSLIRSARRENLKLIFLWFGLWKNSESMYVPAWMKQDTETYFRVEKVNGDKINTISPLSEKAVEKDKTAFTALMRHIREVDEKEQTVIIIQVENEIGVMGTGRDYSDAANRAFNGPVPEKAAALAGKTGTWKEVFGDDAEESFMAWHFASAVETIASAGKAEYDLPCYANAWLRQYPWYPGSYPCGGPVESMHAIWKAAAPSLFALAPDIYVPYCADVMDTYSYEGNPLFIPEIRKDAVASSYCLYAFGAKNAIGFSPFGIEDLALDPSAMDMPPMEVMIALNIDPSAFDITGSRALLSETYDLLHQMEPLLLKYRATPDLKAFIRHGEYDYGTYLTYEECGIAVAYGPRESAKPLGSGIIIRLAPNRFLITGMRSTITFLPKEGDARKIDFIRMEEGRIRDGEWVPGRTLNGDEKMSVKLGDAPTQYLIETYAY